MPLAVVLSMWFSPSTLTSVINFNVISQTDYTAKPFVSHSCRALLCFFFFFCSYFLFRVFSFLFQSVQRIINTLLYRATFTTPLISRFFSSTLYVRIYSSVLQTYVFDQCSSQANTLFDNALSFLVKNAFNLENAFYLTLPSLLTVQLEICTFNFYVFKSSFDD